MVKTRLKRMIALLLALACMASFAACGSDETADDETTEATQETTAGAHDAVMDMIDSVAEENSGADVGVYEVPAESDFIWEDTDGGVAITDYTGTITAVEVPAQLGGKDVIEIREAAFNDAQAVGVKLPDTVVTVGEKAFFFNTTLVELVLGSGTKVLGVEALEGCLALTHVELNEGLADIERMAFANTPSLQNVTLPSTLTEIGEGAFVLSGITSIVIPGSVVLIDEQAFDSCEELTTLVIEDGVQKIADSAFQYCFALNHIEIPASVTEIGWSAFWENDNPVIYAPAGSAAESYALENGIDFEEKK